MTFGFQAVNGSNVVSVSDETKGYIYLGKYGPFGNSGEVYAEAVITCVGYPLVFISCPYNFTVGDGGDSGARSGVAIQTIRPLGGNQWKVIINGLNASTYYSGGVVPMGTYLRVFGRLDLNLPYGSGDPFGFFLWDAAGNLVFDSGVKMLRLAGASYTAEVALNKNAPDRRGNFTAYDTTITVPFNMAGKSICAGVRGLVYSLELVAQYTDIDNNQVFQYATYGWGCGYWATGSTLIARKLILDQNTFESNTSVQQIDNSNLNTVYTRLAVINDSQYP